MVEMLWTFLPVAALLTITPGAATTLGNAAGVMAWALAVAVGLAAGVAGATRRLGESAWLKRAQQACGAVLVGLGVRLAFERR